MCPQNRIMHETKFRFLQNYNRRLCKNKRKFDTCVLLIVIPSKTNYILHTFIATMANNYSNADILNMFYTYGECERVLERTVRVFNMRNPHLMPLTKRRFRKFERKFTLHGQIKVKLCFYF